VIAIVTVLFALPLGYFVRNPVAAYVGYIAVYGWAFTFQSVYLILAIDQPAPAFERGEFPVGYGLVTLAIYLVGFGLVALGRRLRARRTSGTPAVPETAAA
jgi:hydrogenase/urease accessory protein HupE